MKRRRCYLWVHAVGRNRGLISVFVDGLMADPAQAAWLERRLEVDRQAVAKILKLNPSLFGSSIEKSLEPKLVWLREGLGLEEPDIALVVRACPNILRQDIGHAGV